MSGLLEFVKSLFITPLALVWEYVYRLRRLLYNCGVCKRFFFQMPIISVGNIAFGGTGKTPLTVWLTKLANEHHLRPVVLTRGHKGRYEHSHQMVEAKKSFKYNPVDFGDEPLMIARHLKQGAVIVGKRRSENLAFFFDRIRPDIGILDDGFQHLRLFRNLNIVSFDATMPLTQYRMAPKGYLREGLTALADADAIVIGRCDQVSDHQLARLEDFLRPYVPTRAKWSRICYRPMGVCDASFNRVFRVEQLRGQKVVAAAAVAAPQSFFRQLTDLGSDVVERVVFPDHYYFTLKDIEQLLEVSRSHDARLIVTEKDMIKIRKISTEIAAYYLEVEVDFMAGCQELKQLIKDSVTWASW